MHVKAGAETAAATRVELSSALPDLEPQICDLVRMAQIAHRYAMDDDGADELLIFTVVRLLDMADQLKAGFYAKIEEGRQL